jgi:hypothetical protein
MKVCAWSSMSPSFKAMCGWIFVDVVVAAWVVLIVVLFVPEPKVSFKIYNLHYIHWCFHSLFLL